MNLGINENNPKDLISIIIPFLNAEKFIQEAIESVFAQTYSNWELLLIDDGSTDGSTKIARQYAEQYPQKVTYIEHANHKNRGLPASRNVGINASKGEYITFLDADDIWVLKKLEQQVAIMDAYPEVTMAYGPIFNWYSWRGKPEDAKRDHLERFNIKKEDYNIILKPPDLLRKLVKHMNVEPGISGLIARRAMLEQVGGFEESIPAILEDIAFCVKVFLSEHIFISNQIWWKYRQHPDSVCHSIDKQKHCTTSLRFWEWTKQYLTDKGFKDKEIMLILEERIQKRRLGRLD